MQRRAGTKEPDTSQEYLSKIYQCSKDAMGFVGLDGTLLDVNDSFLHLTGYSKEELLAGMKYPELTPAEYHDYEAGVVDTIIRTGEPAEYEKEYVKKDGSRVPILLTVFLVRGKEGEPRGLGAIIKDITRRKRAEAMLRESEARYRDLADSLPQIVFELDVSGNILFANRNALDSFGYSVGDLDQGVNVFQMVVPEDRDSLKGRMRQVLAREETGPTEYTALRRDGSTFPVMVYSSPILEENKAVGLRGIAMDITGLKQVQRDLEASQRRYQDMFNYASDAIFIRDLDGKIIEVNRAAATLTGYSVDELGRMNVYQLLPPDGFKTAMKRQEILLNSKGSRERYELELIRKDGTKCFVESVIGLILENGRPVRVQSIARDITEQRRLRENLQSYVTQILRAQEEERKRIARELHDETAQSLTGLLLDIEGVSRVAKQSPDEIPHLLNELRNKASMILEAVRRFSHALRPDVLDQLGLLPALDLLVMELRDSTRISAHIEVEGLERRLPAEKELALFRIAQEALHNIRRHSKATQVLVRVEFSKDKVRLTVSDNGCGFRLPETSVDFASTGRLGLAGMHERARLVGGNLSIKSELGRGTAVVVEVL